MSLEERNVLLDGLIDVGEFLKCDRVDRGVMLDRGSSLDEGGGVG